MKNYLCPLCKGNFGPRAKTAEEARENYQVYMERLEKLVAHVAICRKEHREKERSKPH